MAIVTGMCTKEIKGGAPHAFAASKIIVSKSVHAHEANVAVVAVIVLPYRAFLTLWLT